MRLEVLIAAMNQDDYLLPKKMNIQSDAIVGNQCSRNDITELIYNGFHVKYLSFAEKGVGLNRNNALMRSSADICVLADDDEVFLDGYADLVIDKFREYPNADVIIFNLVEDPPRRYVTQRTFEVGFRNFMRFGAARLAFRRTSVTKAGISFNLHFGGGAEYSAGEDTLFLYECLRKGLKIVAVPDFIANLYEERESTWFRGYTDKYFEDKGALFCCMSKRWAKLLSLQHAIRHRKLFRDERTWKEAYLRMVLGIKRF